MPLHLNTEDLLSARTVESDRIEFKEGWNPDAVYRSICAFANDFDNIGGGYILIGVAENLVTKTAMRPVKGLSTKQIGAIQQEMIGFNNLIKPYYAPRLFVEAIDGQQIIVLWINGGGERPYEVPAGPEADSNLHIFNTALLVAAFGCIRIKVAGSARRVLLITKRTSSSHFKPQKMLYYFSHSIQKTAFK